MSPSERSAAYGQGLPPKRKRHLTVFEKLEQAEAKIRQAHKRASRAAPQRTDEEWGRAPGVSAAEQRAYAVGVLHGLGQAVRYLNEAKPCACSCDRKENPMPDAARGLALGPSEDYRALLRGEITPEEYVRRMKADGDARRAARARDRRPYRVR